MKDNQRGSWIAVLCAVAWALAAANGAEGWAADWPTHRGNSQRNAVTEERLSLPLSPVWLHLPRFAPEPAWPPPAKQDFWHGESNLAPRVDFDLAYHVAVAGDSLFYGSPAEHAVHCLDAGTGALRWSFFTEGPVRFAPVVRDGKVYFGSDDGNVYGLKATGGELLWKYQPSSDDRRLPGNGHMISLWPVRTGLVVEDQAVYAGAGLFPDHGVYLFALDADTGKEVWKRSIPQPAQGYLAADAGALWVPSGRTGMMAVALRDGKDVGSIDTCGTYLVATQGRVFCESSRYQRHLLIWGALARPDHFVTVQGETAYFQGPREIAARTLTPYVQRATELAKQRSRHRRLSEELKKAGTRDPAKAAALRSQLDALRKTIADLEDQVENKSHLWRRKDSTARSFVLAGDMLFCGRDGRVTAAQTGDGAEVWTAKVAGRAYGLAVAQGRLFVSTDEGGIYCFQSGQAAPLQTVTAPEPASPYPHDDLDAAYTAAAETILGQVPDHKGYALVLDCGEGRLACEIAKRSEFRVVGVEADAAKAARARESLAKTALLGRVSVHHIPKGKLPYPKYFANLVVSDDAVVSGKLPADWSEIRRVLRPYGGVAMFGGPRLTTAAAEESLRAAAVEGSRVLSDRGVWVALRRGALAGAGEWTHQYANPANTICSGDTLVRGRMAPLWFGQPGPRDMIDRHNRTMAPLWKEGRLFVPANERVIALDAYNGTRLWEVDLPGSRRLGVMKDAAHMALADDLLYIAVADACCGLNVATGRREVVLQSPPPEVSGKYQWGYVAVVEDQIFGSIQKSGASLNRQGNMCPILEGDFRQIILSEELFSLDRRTGQTRWRYAGAIPNSAVALGDGRVYFLEARDGAPAGRSLNGRVRIDQLFSGPTFLVALDAKSGRKVWEIPLRLPFEHIVYLCYAPATDAVLLSGTFNGKVGAEDHVFYGLRTFRSDTGALLWQQDIAAGDINGTHGEQWQHPVILDGEVLTKYFECDLRTGALLPRRTFHPGHGCGTLSGSASTIFLRGGNPQMFDMTSGTGAALNHVSRPGCFVNIIPAGGIISIPESSSGCTCSYPLQASFAYVPEPEPD